MPTTHVPTVLFPDAVLTGEVFEHLRLPGDQRYELVDGQVEHVTPTNLAHAETMSLVGVALRRELPKDWHVLSGDPGLYIAPRTVRGPDVIVISAARMKGQNPKRAFLTVVPELVIEIVSPSNSPEDIARKVLEYVTLGSEVWIVNVEDQTVEISAGKSGRTMPVDHVFPPACAAAENNGIPIAEFFRRQ